eukprot:GHVR01178648.1.p1 GENE.GHVR01178648.1~~GHVR01178648.1.p1  ORF type:complete len:350 (-),score=70.42 GHVR01178648.1:155-1177(-)
MAVVAQQSHGEDVHMDSATVAVPTQITRKSGLMAPTMLLTGHLASITSIDFSPDGRHIASASVDKKILLWNVYGECENWCVFSGHNNAVLQTKWSPDGSQVYSCSADKSCAAWDVETGQRIKKFSGHSAIVNSCGCSLRSPPVLVSGSDDGTAKVWDLRTRRCATTFEYSYQLLSVVVDDSQQRILAGCLDDTIRVFDLRTGKEDEGACLFGHTDSVTGLDISKDGTRLASNSMDNTVRVWDIKPFYQGTTRCIHTLHGAQHSFEKNLLRVRWSPSGKFIACGSEDRCAYIWNMYEGGRLMFRLPGHFGTVQEVSFHPTEPIIGSCGADKRIYVGELSEV